MAPEPCTVCGDRAGGTLPSDQEAALTCGRCGNLFHEFRDGCVGQKGALLTNVCANCI